MSIFSVIGARLNEEKLQELFDKAHKEDGYQYKLVKLNNNFKTFYDRPTLQKYIDKELEDGWEYVEILDHEGYGASFRRKVEKS